MLCHAFESQRGLKIFTANLKRPKAVNPVRLNQGKPLCIAIDRDLGQNFREKETKEIERNI